MRGLLPEGMGERSLGFVMDLGFRILRMRRNGGERFKERLGERSCMSMQISGDIGLRKKEAVLRVN